MHWPRRLHVSNVDLRSSLVGSRDRRTSSWTRVHRASASRRSPANETQFLSDDDLEGRRLERVLGWSLLFVTMFAVVMLVYLVREPARQDESIDVLRGRFGRARRDVVRELGERGLRRGAVAAVRELPRQRRRRRLDDAGDRPRRARRSAAAGAVRWKAPALNTELLRFSAGRGRADHHLRPARHADAGVRGRRRRRRERADDRGPRRVHPVDPADARGGAGGGRRRRWKPRKAKPAEQLDRRPQDGARPTATTHCARRRAGRR